jgi:uncharacterized protein YggE
MRVLYAALAALTLTGAASANISVTGTGKVTYVPDLGVITVGVSSEGKTAGEAWEKNGEVVRRLFAALKKLGLEPRDLQTTGVNVAPRYFYPKDQPPRLLGFTATYDLTIKVRKLDLLGKVLDEMVEAGANRNVGIRFTSTHHEKLLDDARARAVAEARKKAEIYVKGAGAALGQVVSISEGAHTPGRHYRYEYLARAADGRPPLPIAAGEQEMTVTVTVTWNIVHVART